MNEIEQNRNALKKILNSGKMPSSPEVSKGELLIEKFLEPSPPAFNKTTRLPGRPKIDDKLKAKNFTLCLAQKYLQFLDELQVPEKKIKGRGRKIRFIIDQFLELKRRQNEQLKFLKDSLRTVEKVLKEFSPDVKKGKKLELSVQDRSAVTKSVNHVLIIIKLQAYTPKSLFKILPKDEWSILSFCLEWSQKKGIRP